MPVRPASTPRRPGPGKNRARPPASPPLLDYAEALLFQLQLSGLPQPEREFVFHRKRKWRFDLAWPDLLIAVEVEGGIWTGGRHVRGQGYEADCEKYNEAQLAGWMVLRFTPGMIKRDKAGSVIEKAIRRALEGEI
jgi:hypothetical protein